MGSSFMATMWNPLRLYSGIDLVFATMSSHIVAVQLSAIATAAVQDMTGVTNSRNLPQYGQNPVLCLYGRCYHVPRY